MTFRPLPGRVAVRVVEPLRVGLIHLPDQHHDNLRAEDRSLGILAQSSHRGVVLDKGPPARMPWGTEVPHGFEVDDEIVFVFAANGTEASRRGFWHGEPCVWIAQEEVLAVIEDAS